MWTYAKKAFVALVLSFILMYAGLFSLSLAQGGYKHEDSLILSPESSFFESKIMDADYKLKIRALDLYVKLEVNQKTVCKYNKSPEIIYLNLTKGDLLSVSVTNNQSIPVPFTIYYEPELEEHNSRFFEITGLFLFALSAGFSIAGISWLYLLLRVEKRRGKFVSEPFKQPKKIPNVEEMPIAECPNCHKRIPADSKICPYCGTKFDSSIAICGSCGSPIPPDAVVCPYCGAKLR